MPIRKRKRRLNGYDRHKRRMAAGDAAACHDCREPIDLSLPKTHRRGLTVDHVIPRCLQGRSTKANLAPAHRDCNERRGKVAERILKDLKRLGLTGKAD